MSDPGAVFLRNLRDSRIDRLELALSLSKDEVSMLKGLVIAKNTEVDELKSERMKLLGYISTTHNHSNRTAQEVVEWWESFEDIKRRTIDDQME